MATEMITLKLDSNFLKDIDSAVKAGNFQSRTEFIRNAVRSELENQKLSRAMENLSRLRGIIKGKITVEDEHRIREKVFRRAAKKHGFT